MGVTYVGDRPQGRQLPYVLFTSDTEAEDAFYSDASGRTSDATLTLTVWADDDGTTRAVASEVIATLTGTLPVSGFGLVRSALELNSRLPAQPGQPQGRALRFRYTAHPA